MKAAEYYEKYHRQIMGPLSKIRGFKFASEQQRDDYISKVIAPSNAAASEMFREFNREIQGLIESRGCRTPSAICAVISELNERWNAMIPMFERDYKESPIKRNAINRIYVKDMPEIRPFLRGSLEE